MEFIDIATANSHLAFNKILWISIKPLAKIFLPALAGIALVRAKKLDDAGIRVAAQIQIYAALPSLVFSNIIPSISADASLDIVLCIAAGLTYMLVAAAIAFGLRKIVWVPDNFRWGFIVAATWSNWGNLPLSVIESVFSGKPFGHPGDVKLGIAFCSFFILVNNSTVFAGPGLWMIQQDFKKPKPQDDDQVPLLSEEADEAVGDRARHQNQSISSSIIASESGVDQRFVRRHVTRAQTSTGISASWRARRRWPLVDGGVHRIPDTPATSEAEDEGEETETETEQEQGDEETDQLMGNRRKQRQPLVRQATLDRNVLKSRQLSWIHRHIFTPTRRFCRNFFTPVTTALLAAVVIALIPPVKGLLTPLPLNNPHHLPSAPDGQPIFAFVLDATSYLGAAAVPLSLLVLGASTARMKVPRPLSKLPIAAIVAVTVLKLVILPCLAFTLFAVLRKSGVVTTGSRKDQLLQFVILYMSSGLTATNQVALSALAAAQAGFTAGEGNLDLLCAFIVIQYFVYPFTGTIVIAACLRLVAS